MIKATLYMHIDMKNPLLPTSVEPSPHHGAIVRVDLDSIAAINKVRVDIGMSPTPGLRLTLASRRDGSVEYSTVFIPPVFGAATKIWEWADSEERFDYHTLSNVDPDGANYGEESGVLVDLSQVTRIEKDEEGSKRSNAQQWVIYAGPFAVGRRIDSPGAARGESALEWILNRSWEEAILKDD